MTLLYNLHHLFVGAGQDNTNDLRLVLAYLAVKTGMVDAVLDSLGAVAHSIRESYELPIEVRSCLVGIVGCVHFAVGGLALDMARHSGIVAAAPLQVAHGVLDITHSLIRCLMYKWCSV